MKETFLATLTKKGNQGYLYIPSLPWVDPPPGTKPGSFVYVTLSTTIDPPPAPPVPWEALVACAFAGAAGIVLIWMLTVDLWCRSLK